MLSGKKEIKLGDAIKAAFEESGINERLEETRLLENLESILGKHISKHIISKRISKNILYIRIDSAALRHELSYRRDELKTALNKTISKELIKEVVFS